MLYHTYYIQVSIELKVKHQNHPNKALIPATKSFPSSCHRLSSEQHMVIVASTWTKPMDVVGIKRAFSNGKVCKQKDGFTWIIFFNSSGKRWSMYAQPNLQNEYGKHRLVLESPLFGTIFCWEQPPPKKKGINYHPKFLGIAINQLFPQPGSNINSKIVCFPPLFVSRKKNLPIPHSETFARTFPGKTRTEVNFTARSTQVRHLRFGAKAVLRFVSGCLGCKVGGWLAASRSWKKVWFFSSKSTQRGIFWKKKSLKARKKRRNAAKMIFLFAACVFPPV